VIVFDPSEYDQLSKKLNQARDEGDEAEYEKLRLEAITGGIDWRRRDLSDRLNREFPPYGIEPVAPQLEPAFDPDFDREVALKEALDKGDTAEFVRISEQYPADTPTGDMR
jgi:hypothetical protein